MHRTIFCSISFKRQLIFIEDKSIIPGILNLLDICDHLKANKTIGNIICKNSSCWSFDVVLLCCAREKMFWQVFGNLGSQCVRSKYQILKTSILGLEKYQMWRKYEIQIHIHQQMTYLFNFSCFQCRKFYVENWINWIREALLG